MGIRHASVRRNLPHVTDKSSLVVNGIWTHITAIGARSSGTQMNAVVSFESPQIRVNCSAQLAGELSAQLHLSKLRREHILRLFILIPGRVQGTVQIHRFIRRRTRRGRRLRMVQVLEEPSPGSHIDDRLDVRQILAIAQIEGQPTEVHSVLELLVEVLGGGGGT